MKLPKISVRAFNRSNAQTPPPSGGGLRPWDVAPDVGEHRVFRSVAFDVETFDAFKTWERILSAKVNRKLTNNEVLRMLVLSHLLNVEVVTR